MNNPKIAFFPGSFDPFTKGHEDIVLRSLALFDEVIIGIGQNSSKDRYFALEKIKAGGNLLNNGDSPEDQLYRAIREFNPHFNNSSKSFGMILKYRKGRVCSGLKLTTCGQVDKTTLWSVQVVDLKEVIAQNQQKYSIPDGN
jgi:cytidyltransferase-like protein